MRSEDGTDYSVAIDKIGCRNGGDAVSFVDAATCIKEKWIREAKLRTEGTNVILWVGLIDAEQGKFTTCSKLGIDLL